jgi:Ca-activated chloride channel family protein
VQVELDPTVVEKYRLIGYDNREVADKDFKNDKVDGGEIGAGHSVTAIYDVVLKRTDVSPLSVHVRHKKPLGSAPSVETVYAMPVSSIAKTFEASESSFRLAVAVTGFAEVLRDSPFAKDWRLGTVATIAKGAAILPAEQAELLELVDRSKTLGARF